MHVNPIEYHDVEDDQGYHGFIVEDMENLVIMSFFIQEM